jgi:hypothetical protein
VDIPTNPGGDPAEERIRRAVRRIPVDPALQVKVRASVEQSRRTGRLRRHLLWIGLAAAPAILLWFFRPLPAAPDLPELAASQHAACAVAHLLPVEPWNHRRGGLRAFVRRQMPGEFRLLDAHLCRTGGRTYEHFVIGWGEGPISLLVVSLRSGETVGEEWIVPIPRGRYRVSSAQAGTRAVFLVSDLPPGLHEKLASSLDPHSMLGAIDAQFHRFCGPALAARSDHPQLR